MFRIFRHKEVSLRFFGTKMALLCNRDAVRAGFTGDIAEGLWSLCETAGFAAVYELAHGGEPAQERLKPVYRVVRHVWDDFEARTGPTFDSQMGLPLLNNYSIQHRIPINVQFEITYRCNLRCEHCYVLHKVSEPEPEHMNKELALKILREIADLGCLNVTITGGESLLHRDLRDIVKASKDLHMFTAVKTNGLILTRKRAEEYAEEPGHSTHLSLYGSTAEVHDAMTAMPGSFDKTLKGMKTLAAAGVRAKVFVLIWKENAHQVEDMERLVADHGHDVSFSDLINGRLNGDKTPRNFKIDAETRQGLVDAGYLTPFEPAACSAGAMKLKVDPSGRVYTCEFLPTAFGNLAETSLESIWEQKEYTEFSDKIIRLSKYAPSPGLPTVNSCPGLNLLNRGTLYGRTEV